MKRRDRKFDEEVLYRKLDKRYINELTYEKYEKEYVGYMLYDPFIDRYFADKDELLEYYETVVNMKPPFAVNGTTRTSIELNLDSMIEDACYNLHEDIADNIDNILVGVKTLQEAIWKFEEENAEGTASYEADEYMVVFLEDGGINE